MKVCFVLLGKEKVLVTVLWEKDLKLFIGVWEKAGCLSSICFMFRNFVGKH